MKPVSLKQGGRRTFVEGPSDASFHYVSAPMATMLRLHFGLASSASSFVATCEAGEADSLIRLRDSSGGTTPRSREGLACCRHSAQNHSRYT